ncbi:MAG: DUF6502 family protein [Candidatus Binatia bacterium]
MADSTDGAAKRALLNAVRAILRPLVRQLIAHGVTYPAFSRLAKEVFIDVGTRDFTLPFKKQTDSRVALVTGITRKEIGQIRRGQAPAPSAALELHNALAARIVGRWLAAPPYVDEAGVPRLLSYEAGPDAASFVSLVGELGGDIPARAVLDELLRVGAATLTPRGNVRLAERAYVPAQGAEEKFAILGTDATDLIEAVVHNIECPRGEAFLQRTVRYDNIGAEALPAVREQVRALGAEFVQAVNRLLSDADRDVRPAAPGGQRSRAVVAVYYFDRDVK